jgi:hypothetical protein
MRYAALYRSGTVQLVAFVHVEDDGTITLARPMVLREKETLSVTYLPDPEEPSVRRPRRSLRLAPACFEARSFRDPLPFPEAGRGPEGTYHA